MAIFTHIPVPESGFPDTDMAESEDELNQPASTLTQSLGKRPRCDQQKGPSQKRKVETALIEKKIKEGVEGIRSALQLDATITKGSAMVQKLVQDLQDSQPIPFVRPPSFSFSPNTENAEIKELVKELSATVKQLATQQQKQVQAQVQAKPIPPPAPKKEAAQSKKTNSQPTYASMALGFFPPVPPSTTNRNPALSRKQPTPPQPVSRKEAILQRKLVLITENGEPSHQLSSMQMRDKINSEFNDNMGLSPC